ncbi:hypothetical protein SY88_17275 [Clostridiales bacterium PH28_bin88]|nr:hypothetical protein SY88_17275 [Clostridiales bacterium PH28_bin88]
MSDVALRNWYNNSFKKAGIYSETVKNFKYILVSAGEKSTGGYSLSMAGVIGRPGEILIYAVIVPPKNSQIVNGPSYPHALIRIKEDGREVFLGGLREPDEKELEPPKVQVRPRSTYVLYKEPNPGKILRFRSTFQGIPPSWEVVGGTMAEVLESQGEWVI